MADQHHPALLRRVDARIARHLHGSRHRADPRQIVANDELPDRDDRGIRTHRAKLWLRYRVAPGRLPARRSRGCRARGRRRDRPRAQGARHRSRLPRAERDSHRSDGALLDLRRCAGKPCRRCARSSNPASTWPPIRVESSLPDPEPAKQLAPRTLDEWISGARLRACRIALDPGAAAPPAGGGGWDRAVGSFGRRGRCMPRA